MSYFPQTIDHSKAQELNDYFAPPKEISDLVRRIQRLEKIAGLCGEMMGTLTIPGNQAVFAVLPESFHQIVENWKGRFDALQV